MDIAKFERILSITQQQVRYKAFEIGRLNVTESQIKQEQETLQTIVAEYNQKFGEQFQNSSTTAERKPRVESKAIHFKAVQLELKRLQLHSNKLQQQLDKNQELQTQVKQEYQTLHSKELALKKLIERKHLQEKNKLMKTEEIELSEKAITKWIQLTSEEDEEFESNSDQID